MSINMALRRDSLKVPILKTNRLPRLLIDQDDVLADYNKHAIKKFNERFYTNFTTYDCTEWNLEAVFGKRIWEVVTEKGFFLELEPIKDAIETFKRLYLSGRYDMFIVTAADKEAYLEKVQWVKYHMPFFDERHFISAKSKDAIWGDILLDDSLHNATNFKKIGEPIVFDRPYNRKTDEYKRVYNWSEFEAYVEDMFYAKIV